MARLIGFSVVLSVIGALCILILTGQVPGTAGPVREAPRPDDWRALRVGQLAHDLSITGVDGTSIALSEMSGRSGFVVAMTDQGCPVSKRYLPTLVSLAGRFSEVEFVLIDLTPEAELLDRATPANMHVIQDPDRAWAAKFSPRTTAETFLLDPSLTIRYRGAIDDQYGIGYSRRKANRTYLIDAIEQLSVLEDISLRATTAPGCYLSIPLAKSNAAITYHNRISRIVRDNCETCHRDGGSGPFALDTYRNVYGYASMINFVVSKDIMPPWFASERDGRWANERRLGEADRNDLLSWIDDGMPEGDAKQAPMAAHWPPGWTIGTPDAVVELPREIEIPASGVVDYQYVYLKTDFGEDRWIQRMEVLPTAPQATHHVLVFLEEPGRKQEGRRRGEPRFQGGLGGYFASTVPGQQAAEFPPGMSKRLPKGAWLKFQLHYTPNGEATTDRTRLGFIFADNPPEHEILTAAAFNVDFEIPPGEPNHKVVGDYRFRQAGTLTGFFPHMHYRGKAFRYELQLPDGEVRELLDVPRYDFNWQLGYQLTSPIEVPAGAILRATAWFDNSPENPANPDPAATVYFGEQTFEEMMIGYFDWYRK